MYKTNSIDGTNISENVLPPKPVIAEAIEQLAAFAKRNGYEFYGEFDEDNLGTFDAMLFKDGRGE